ncbi:MocR-like pyridoxine biosynthesis transcription factor PdxR [Conexibacter woesei]|uniref:Transcriptional regulator, GntR family with aminotransferase domain n=1 Tax=Conexibacter woesei (strain DSM 14684 / CCUG 47730 / CIP 108061 / JCM 11494 / NBRC 100937 / ID131577) TaxID=469383 RepID=D3F7Q0_CONWI|nr:PLP-dependent aminotransferase family protein [Conexibacter woesei]ADB50912.1 transcriptional regulator, GntR family with aminotransferase domain [Conexibacter woesei DSM 14684]
MPDPQSTSGPELLLPLDRAPGAPPLHAQLEEALREAVRGGTLAPGTRLPASRVLAADVGVSRQLVVEAYTQLVAEGYLEARRGSGTRVAATSPSLEDTPPPPGPTPPPPRFDFRPGLPDLGAFPRTAWRRVLVRALRDAPAAAFGYPDPQGEPALRATLAGYLRRVRGVAAAPERIVICGGFAQALGLLGAALRERGETVVALEDPGVVDRDAMLARSGLATVPVPVDADGLRIDALARTTARAVVTTPTHQFPLGVALAPARRARLLDWAREHRLVIEDDYDAEFRYDRTPVGALQGLAPEHVAYVGSASKTLAPALRLGWIVAPAALVPALVEAKRLADRGTPALDQLALSELIDSGGYDRHLRQLRRRYRERRTALATALAQAAPAIELTGMDAGLHAVAHLPRGTSAAAVDALLAAAARDGVAAHPLARYHADPSAAPPALVLGYAQLSTEAIAEGVARLAATARGI